MANGKVARRVARTAFNVFKAQATVASPYYGAYRLYKRYNPVKLGRSVRRRMIRGW